MKNKRLKIGSYTVILSAIVIATVIIINMAVAALPSSLRVFETDGYDIYEMSKQTEEIVKGVNEKISIYLITEEGNKDEKLSEFINRYSQLNNKITVSIVDPIVHPSVTTISGTNQNLTKLTQNSIIVSSTVRDKVISKDEIYKVEYSDEELNYYYTMGVTPTGTTYFYGEDKISSAIDYVLASSLPTLYFTVGHGEEEPGATLEYYIEADNFNTAELSLMRTESVPSDASCIFINLPSKDINETELELLKEYVDRGGRLILVSDIGSYDGGFKNLKALAAHFGMDSLEGSVTETDTSCLSADGLSMMPILSESDSITALWAEYDLPLTSAAGFTVSDDLPDSLSVTKLITTSDKAYTSAEHNVGEEDKKLYEGECVLGAIASVSAKDTKGAFVWYTSPSMTNNDVDELGGASVAVVLTTLQSLCEKDSDISIAAKAVSAASLMIDENDSNFWSTLMTTLVPIGILLIGLGVRYTRRSR